MTEIRGAEGLSRAELLAELERGGRVVTFDWAVSVCVITFTRSSVPHLVRAGEGTFAKALPYTLLTLLVGWWALPLGPLLTIGVVITNLGGGKDLTHRLLPPPPPPPGPSAWERFKEGG